MKGIKIGVPQIIMICLSVSSLTIALMQHGQYKTEKKSFWVTLLAVTLQNLILYLGGFYQ